MLFPTMHLPHLHLGFRVASGFVLMGRLTHPLVPNTVPVRQVSGLPCDFLQIPPRDGHPCLRLCAWCYLLRSRLSPVRSCPCWAHQKKGLLIAFAAMFSNPMTQEKPLIFNRLSPKGACVHYINSLASNNYLVALRHAIVIH